MLTAESREGMLATVVFAGLWLVFSLWQDWGQAGRTARARASAKANGWAQDEMQNAITRNAALLGYRVMEVGLFVVMMVDILVFRKNVTEFSVLWWVCMMAERCYKTVTVYRAAQGDEEAPPSGGGLIRTLAKDILIPLLVFGGILWRWS